MSTEKRLFLFLVLTFMVLAGYAGLMEVFGPKRPPLPVAQDAKKDTEKNKVPEKNKDAVKNAEPGKAEEPGIPLEADKSASKDSGKTGQQPAVAAVKAGEPGAVAHPHRVVTLGSYRPRAGDSPLLVTLTSRGGALKRVELVQRTADGKLRYVDLDHTYGYLGNLALSLASAGSRGCRINSVPPGSPAAIARPMDSVPAATTPPGTAPSTGLQIGDLLTQVDDELIETPEDLGIALSRLKPGNTVKLKVQRLIKDKPQTLRFLAKLDVRPLELIRPEPLEKGELTPHPPSLLLEIKDGSQEQSKFLDKLSDVEWETVLLQPPDSGVEFRYVVTEAVAKELGLAAPIEVIKRYRLGERETAPAAGAAAFVPAYHLDFDIELRTTAAQPQSVALRLDGTNGLPTEGWWYLTKIHPRWFHSAGARDVMLHTDSDGQRLIGCSTIFSRAKKDEKSPRTPLFSEKEPVENRSLAHIGIDTQYFASALIPQAQQPNARSVFSRAEAIVLGDVTKKPKHWERTANVTYQLTTEPIQVSADAPHVEHFRLFAGPKDPAVLAAYGLGDWIYYGWFGLIARFLSSILHLFYAIFANYGIAIILLTVLVRSCMFPVSRTAARNAAMMQELAPEMRKIAEKHKNNLEARGKAQQELFRQNNYNPLSGCWLMFLQLPVFIGLYRCLAVDIELRQAPLIPGVEWCSNLAGPDKLFYWKNDFFSYFTDESGWLGPYFNLLPLFTIVLFLVHQKLFTPPATDEQTEMQMKMMKFMTVFMGVLFYKVPAGLCLYFITSSLWGIAERKLLPKPTPRKKEEGGDGGSRFAALFRPKTPPQAENGNARKKELERKMRRNK